MKRGKKGTLNRSKGVVLFALRQRPDNSGPWTETAAAFKPSTPEMKGRQAEATDCPPPKHKLFKLNKQALGEFVITEYFFQQNK